mmetsp:Transcript_39746/g.94216  ORF Transcript_39746/g.94216 Transcript_39746/m.94216 type:complete len:226 (-) Transcript_39746:233-910(-)
MARQPRADKCCRMHFEAAASSSSPSMPVSMCNSSLLILRQSTRPVARVAETPLNPSRSRTASGGMEVATEAYTLSSTPGGKVPHRATPLEVGRALWTVRVRLATASADTVSEGSISSVIWLVARSRSVVQVRVPSSVHSTACWIPASSRREWMVFPCSPRFPRKCAMMVLPLAMVLAAMATCWPLPPQLMETEEALLTLLTVKVGSWSVFWNAGFNPTARRDGGG